VPADLARPDEVERLLATLHASAIEIGILINNAGFGTAGAFARTRSTTSSR
jgi:Short-chain dehydrogenases of various substrate specificities